MKLDINGHSTNGPRIKESQGFLGTLIKQKVNKIKVMVDWNGEGLNET